MAGLIGFATTAGPAAAQNNANPYNSLTAEWTAPGDDGDTGQVSAYELVYRETPVGSDVAAWWNAAPYSQRITLFPPLAPAGRLDSTRVTGLSQGTTYYFVLVALDEAANASGYSNVATGATQACGAPTTAPASFDAAAESTGIRLSWAAASDPAAQSLHLYRAALTSSSWSLLTTQATTSTGYFDASVPPGATFRYRATWAGPDIEGVTCEGPYSASLTETVPALPGGVAVSGVGSIHVYPNPSSGPVQIAIDVNAPSALAVRLRLFDMNGRWIATPADGSYPPGRSVVAWDRTGRGGASLAPGYYELLGTVGSARVRERLLLLP
jgi:hypothetical protein